MNMEKSSIHRDDSSLNKVNAVYLPQRLLEFPCCDASKLEAISSGLTDLLNI